MVSELAALRDRAAAEDSFAQTSTRDRLLAILETLPANAPLETQLSIHAELTDDFRRLGQNSEAVHHAELAVALARKRHAIQPDDVLQTVLQLAGVAWLRVAETENCIHCSNGDSCLLPIREGGIHTERRGSEKAAAYFREYLKMVPDDDGVRWLLNIASMTLGEYPRGVEEQFRLPETALADSSRFPRFFNIASAVGLDTFNCAGGVVTEDFDQDGLLDVLTSAWEPSGRIRYFRNTGSGRFEEETEKAGLAGILGILNLVPADFDNDGDIDVLGCRGAWRTEGGDLPNSLLENLGGGRFRDVSFDIGIGEHRHPTGAAAWADYDNDGDVDLFVANEGPASQLYRNDGAAGFTDVAAVAGVENRRQGKAAVWGDWNNDRFPDLYVSNYHGLNRLYRNNCDGTFTDVAAGVGVEEPYISFPAWFWDVNNDGTLDLFAAAYEVGVQFIATEAFGGKRRDEPSKLYLGDGKGGFIDATADFGLDVTMQPMASNIGDLDNDGYLDFYLGTGYPEYDGLMPNLMFRNVNGERFENVTFSGGFGHLQKGHGIAFTDLDNDGDQDVFAQMGGAYPGDAFANALFENPGFGNHWLKIKLTGDRSNRAGIGARIRVDIVEDGSLRSIYRWIGNVGSIGAGSLQPIIGLGHADRITTIEVFWPTTNETQRFESVPLDTWIEIREGKDEFLQHELQHVPFAKTVTAHSDTTPSTPTPGRNPQANQTDTRQVD